MDEILTDGGSYVNELDSGNPYLEDNDSWGASEGTIILPITATPSPIADNLNSGDPSEEVNNEILNELIKINEKLDNDEYDLEEEQEEEGKEEDNIELEENETSQQEVYDEDILSLLTEIKENQILIAKNNDLYNEFILGFIVAFFFGFVIYIFLHKLRG